MDNAAIEKQNEVLKNDAVKLEKQTAYIKSCELEKEKTTVNEKYYIDQVDSLQPLLEEAKDINRNLVQEVESLEEIVLKKDNDILVLQNWNYEAQVKLSKTRKYIRHRERECHHELQHQDFQLRSLVHQSTFKMKSAVKKRDFFLGKANFLENKCKELEIALQNSSINMQQTSNEELITIKSELKEAKKDFELSQKAYNDLRLEVKSNESLKKKLEDKKK